MFIASAPVEMMQRENFENFRMRLLMKTKIVAKFSLSNFLYIK